MGKQKSVSLLAALGVLILALLWAGFAGCKYKLAIVPVEDEDDRRGRRALRNSRREA